MKKKNLITLLMIGAMVGGLLAGCGDSEPAETAVEATEEVAETEEAVEEVVETEEAETEEAVEEPVEEPVVEEEPEVDYRGIFDEWITPLGETATPMYNQDLNEEFLKAANATSADIPATTSEASLTVTCDKVQNDDGTYTSTFHYVWNKPEDVTYACAFYFRNLAFDYNTGEWIKTYAPEDAVDAEEAVDAEGLEGFKTGTLNYDDGGDLTTVTWDYYVTAPDDRDIVVAFYSVGYPAIEEYGIPAQDNHPVDESTLPSGEDGVNITEILDWFTQYKDWVVMSKNS